MVRYLVFAQRLNNKSLGWPDVMGSGSTVQMFGDGDLESTRSIIARHYLANREEIPLVGQVVEPDDADFILLRQDPQVGYRIWKINDFLAPEGNSNAVFIRAQVASVTITVKVTPDLAIRS